MKKIIFSLLSVAVLIAMGLAAVSPPPVSAASSGALYAGTGADLIGVGTVTWSHPGRITADDGSYATADVGHGHQTHYLRASDFGFDSVVPSGATIDGIEVTIGRYSSGHKSPFIQDTVVRLVNGSGTIVGDNKAATTTDWPTGSEAPATYGGVSDDWTASLTAADIRDSDFGVVLSVDNPNKSYDRDAYVDYIRMTVYYTPGCSNNGQFDVELVSVTNNLTDNTQTWCYEVTNLASGTCCHDLSHWVLDLCDTTLLRPVLQQASSQIHTLGTVMLLSGKQLL